MPGFWGQISRWNSRMGPQLQEPGFGAQHGCPEATCPGALGLVPTGLFGGFTHRRGT